MIQEGGGAFTPSLPYRVEVDDPVLDLDELTVEEEIMKDVAFMSLEDDVRRRCEYVAHVAATSAIWSLGELRTKEAVVLTIVGVSFEWATDILGSCLAICM